MADETLAGIPSIPSGAPKEITGWMTAVRNRVLAIKDQFTASEVTRLKALLNAKPASEPITTVDHSVIFLSSPYKFYEGGDIGWTHLNVSAAGVPETATAVLIESVLYQNRQPTGGVGYALARIDASKGNGQSPDQETFVLNQNSIGIAFGTTIDMRSHCQSMVPVASGGLDYYVTNTNYCRLRIAGYAK